VERENPQYVNYLYGYKDDRAFHNGFRQLRDLIGWVMEKDYRVVTEVRYEFTIPKTGECRVLRVPEEVNSGNNQFREVIKRQSR